MKIATAQQMQELDRQTIEIQKISYLQLMERAAHLITEELCQRWDSSHSFLIFAGAGNNGGDALAVARLLFEKGYKVQAYLFNTEGKISPECEENRDRLQKLSAHLLTEVTSSFTPPSIAPQTIILDGLFGIGLRGTLTGGYAALVKFINAAEAFTVAIDMPSGLLSEGSSAISTAPIVQADLTLTFQLPKLAHFLADQQPFVGELKVLDLRLSSVHLEELHTECHLLEAQEVAALLLQRPSFAHKGTFGHGLLIAGSYGMAGAAVLAAQAALRSGIGKLTVHTPAKNNDILQISVPEAVVSHDVHTHYFTSPLSTTSFNALGIGSGIGTKQETAVAFLEQLRHAKQPMVLDADALNILAQHKAWIQHLPKGTILTPHPLEFKRIGHHCHSSYEMLQEAKQMAQQLGIYIVLKGHRTAICTPQRQVFFNSTGNAGMATAGSGDVLTGILTSFLAQGYAPLAAAQLGVYLHGLAGDCAAAAIGEESMTASDIIQHLPNAFAVLRKALTQ